jgi:hypothetical protein
VILRGDDDTERFHARELIRLRDEPVLDRPSLSENRAFGVCCFVPGEHFIDCGIADRVCRHAPPETIQFFHHVGERRLRHRVHAAEGAVLAPRLGVGLAHPPAFEAAVDAELHGADAQPVVAFIGAHVRRGNRRPHRIPVVAVEAHQLIDANRQQSATLHVVEQPVLFY